MGGICECRIHHRGLARRGQHCGHPWRGHLCPGALHLEILIQCLHHQGLYICVHIPDGQHPPCRIHHGRGKPRHRLRRDCRSRRYENIRKSAKFGSGGLVCRELFTCYNQGSCRPVSALTCVVAAARRWDMRVGSSRDQGRGLARRGQRRGIKGRGHICTGKPPARRRHHGRRQHRRCLWRQATPFIP